MGGKEKEKQVTVSVTLEIVLTHYVRSIGGWHHLLV